MATNQLSRVIQHLRKAALPREEGGLTDGQLLDSYIASREEAAFAALVHRHGGMVWGVCRRILASHHDAEDAFQATFLVLVRKAASIVSKEKVANWLYGVAHQTALKARATTARRRGREKEVTAMPEPALQQQELWYDLLPLLDQELSRLPEKYRAVIVVCDLEGKTRKEAARHFNLPEGTVATRLATARTMLARRLARHGAAVSGGALGVMLAQNAASANVPAAVASTTIRAANFFAAGQAAAIGGMSVKAVALADGVIKTMLLTKLKTATVMVLAIALVGTGTAAFTQGGRAEKPAEPAATQDKQPSGQAGQAEPEGTGKTLSGLVKSVDAAKNTLTVAHKDGKDTFTVAKDATIVINGRPGDMTGIRAGARVALSRFTDPKTPQNIEAVGPSLGGVVKAVAAGKNTLTIANQDGEFTLGLTKNADILIDGRPGKLAGVPTGANVLLNWFVDLKTAHALQAEGRWFFGVLVKAVDPANNTITVSHVEGENTFAVAKNANVVIDGKPGKLSGVPVGAHVTLSLRVDQKTTGHIQAEGSPVGGFGGALLKAVDVQNNTITIEDRDGVRTFAVAKDANITIEGKRAKLAGIPVGAHVALVLHVDEKTAGNITAEGSSFAGNVQAVDAEKSILTVANQETAKTLAVTPSTNIMIDGKPGKLAELPAGTRVSLAIAVDEKTARQIDAEGPQLNFVVQAVDAGRNTITVANQENETTFAVVKDAAIVIDGQPGKLSGIPKGARVSVNFSVDRKTARRIDAAGPTFQGLRVKEVDAGNNTITIDEERAPVEVAGKTLAVAKDVSISIDDKAGKLAGIPKGASINLMLSVDQKTARNISAAGSQLRGVVQALDAEKNTIAVEDGEGEKVITAAKDVKIIIDGKAGNLSGIPKGALVTLNLRVDQKTTGWIEAQGPQLGAFGGVVVKEVDAGKGSITIEDREGEKTFAVPPDAAILIDGTAGKLAAVPAGANIMVSLRVDQKTAGRIEAKGAVVDGVVQAVDGEKNTITVATQEDEKTFTVAKDAHIAVDGKPAKLAAIPKGARVNLNLSVDQKTARTVEAKES